MNSLASTEVKMPRRVSPSLFLRGRYTFNDESGRLSFRQGSLIHGVFCVPGAKAYKIPTDSLIFVNVRHLKKEKKTYQNVNL